MNVTRDVVIDLLPLYYSKECSRDTKTLVEEYLKTDPDFEKLANRFAQNLLSKSIPQRLNEEDEMKTLSKTRRQLRLRSFILALAIFFSIVPFSFAYTEGKFYMLLSESPQSALIYGIIGVAFWVWYFMLRQKSSGL